jgi:chromosome segregation protein
MSMRLDRVEIVGFKSFCDKQELSFQGGVTGIVGPNGCGKSNISDAISWVLGEQSVKSLRGTSMEDVIFAGSQSRQPVGMAEVSLKLSGLNGNSPDGNPECVVTRRLFRNGESEYLMNGQVCRLRDIHELFMDTGLGSKAYSIIEQGKIGLILSSKPADRRALIEEAAGITKYKARRRQTQLKLEAAQQNLLRVNDIIHEVEKQLESLKRQASKARRYRAVRDEMQGVERVLFGLRFLDLQAQSASLAERLGREADRERAASIALATEEAHFEARRQVVYEAEARLTEARARLAEATLAVDRHQGKSGYCKEQIADTEARAGQAAQESAELEGRVGPLDVHLHERRQARERLAGELAGAEMEAQGAEAAVHAATERLRHAEREQESARDAQLTVISRISALLGAREKTAGNAERAAADLLKLAAEREELEREQAQVQAAAALARTRREEADTLLGALQAERQAAQARAAEARAQAESLERDADSLQSEFDSLAGRLSSLEEIVATHAAFDEGTRAVLARPDGVDALGVVADLIEADSAHERAVEAFLGDRLQAVLVPDAAQAVRGVRYLQESGAGRGSFLPLRAAGGRDVTYALRETARQEPRVKSLLSDLYRVVGPHAEAVRASLPDGLVCETLEDAIAVADQHPHFPCVTLAGETVRRPVVEGGRGVKGLLAPRREVRELTARRDALAADVAAVRARKDGEAARGEAATAEVRALEEEIHGAEKDLVAIRHDLSVAEEEQARHERKRAVLETEKRQAEEERGAAAVRLAEIEQSLAGAGAEKEAGDGRLGELAAQVALCREESEAAQLRHAEARSALAALRERAAGAEAERQRLAQERQELAARIEAARERMREMQERRSALQAELLEEERLLAEALGQRDRVTGETAVAEDALRDLRNEMEGREQSLRERRRERDMLKDAVAELEVSRARVDSDLDHLGRECHQAVGVLAAEAAVLLTEEDKARDASGLQVQVQELRERLEKMGAVNVLAVEQAQELDERHTFLTAQRQDLLDSIAELDQAVKKIDRASRERFQDAFQAINQHFGEIFRQLFGGGTAGLSLIDESDVLESGIDVMAQPPGKRLQNVMLLSGGEKALTAIALLFAIFQYKPSPFCILDEVDAPLDDANIGRFVRMLEGLKEQTQFVLITHSRRTMEIADQLYGVTMEEPGVSKLVSVRLS